jgi:hypothetical protein
LANQLAFYRRLSLALLIFALPAYGLVGIRWLREHGHTTGVVDIQGNPPHAKEIRRLLAPLRYSITPILMRKDFSIGLDYQAKRWSLRNLHQFDPGGNIILEGGRYGVCGQLAAHVRHQLSSILDPARFSVGFIRVAESGFFPAYITEHFALEIVDRSTDPPTEYILDPSLKRYGEKNRFEEYMSLKGLSTLSFLDTKSADQTFRVGSGTPVEITRQHLVVLSVERQDGVFDPDNFRIVLVAFHRYHYLAHPLIILRCRAGQKDVLEYPDTVRKVFEPGQFDLLKRRLLELFHQLPS